MRRWDDQKRAKKEFDRVRDQPSTKAYHNEKSEKYVKKRFERELRLVQEEIVLGKQIKRDTDYDEQEAAKVVLPDKNLSKQEMI